MLGLYLGDGHVVLRGGSGQLEVTMDGAYPGLLDECADALRTTFPEAAVRVRERPGSRGKRIQLSSRHLAQAFPQHGAGRKHARSIDLEPWQRAITHRHPRQLLRGLIHSDGCRTTNRFRTILPSGRVAEYEYVRYFFTNNSDDIRRIFCEHCELLGVRWTLSNPRNVSVADRASVALLDCFVGRKR